MEGLDACGRCMTHSGSRSAQTLLARAYSPAHVQTAGSALRYAAGPRVARPETLACARRRTRVVNDYHLDGTSLTAQDRPWIDSRDKAELKPTGEDLSCVCCK